MEPEKVNFHPNWLRVMFAVNIFLTGGLALLLIVAPNTAATLFSSPAQEPLFSGYASSYMLGIAIFSIAGLRSPLKFSPLLFLQAIVKIIWFMAILIPAMAAGPLFVSPRIRTWIWLMPCCATGWIGSNRKSRKM